MKEDKNILFLGDEQSAIFHWLKKNGESVIQESEKITEEFIKANNIGFLISYGYRYILEKNILALLPDRAINLHISYLPWNKGADPNLWSFVKNTPKGVTIHYLDEGMDTGDIIVQEEKEFDSNYETLASSYEKLQLSVQALFKLHWRDIKKGTCQRTKQVGRGTVQRAKEREALTDLLVEGWNTPIYILEEYSSEK